MPVLTKINTNVIADNAVTAAKIPAGAVGASEIPAGAVGSSEIADDAVLPANIAYLGDGTGKLSGTLTGQQLRLGTAFTLTDDLTVNGDLTLSKVRADGTGQSLTQDSSANRTITGTGTIRMGHATEKTSIAGFTGILDPTVTGQTVVKAWCNLNGSGPLFAHSSFGIRSFADNGTGKYAIYPTTAGTWFRGCVVTGVSDNLDGGASYAHRIVEAYIPTNGDRVDCVLANESGTLSDAAGWFCAILCPGQTA